MKQQTTFSIIKCFLFIAFSQSINAQQIYNNGGLSTGATANNGTVAPTGYTWSECQNNTGNTTESNNNSGFSGFYNNTGTTNFILADDFVVPAGVTWNITSFEFYVYQTASTAFSPFDALRVQIYNGNPASGGTVVAGNLTANVLNAAASADSFIYRLFNSSVPTGTATGTTRRIWKITGTLSAVLNSGTYWVGYQYHPTNDATAFSPPVTISGSRGAATANGKQNVVASTVAGAVLGWTILNDIGNPATALDYPQDLAFNINGTVTNLAVNFNDLATNFKMYPSPVTDICNFKLNSTNLLIADYVKIYDLKGSLVFTQKINNTLNNESSINLSELNSGTYLIKLFDKNSKDIYSDKLIKD